MFKKITVPLAKLALATTIAYAMLIGSIYLLPSMTLKMIRVGDSLADAIKEGGSAPDSIMVLVALMLDGRVFLIIPFLLLARSLIEAVPYGLAKIGWARAIGGSMTLAIFIGGGYTLLH